MNSNKSVVLSNIVVPTRLAFFPSKSKGRNTWGFTRNCHPEFISGSTPLVIIQNKEEMLKQVQHDNRRGFTLIELVVVIIIIAVLAAVALPMYKHSVLKSKFAVVIPPTKSVADAQEIYYLNNGEYAEDKEALDVSAPDTQQTTVTVSDKKNYKYVMGKHTSIPGAKYIMYQKHSKRFADNIHCEAQKTDDEANWLCEKGLGGTPITGSISGSNFLTYLIEGDAGTDKFIREDCPDGYYDNNGTCTKAQVGYYAEDGEQKHCEAGTSSGWGASVCTICPSGTFQPGSANYCVPCEKGTYTNTEGNSSCSVCPAGTSTSGMGSTLDDCKPCQAGTFQSGTDRYCVPCQAGSYSSVGASGCTQCPSGQKPNADHTGCVPA